MFDLFDIRIAAVILILLAANAVRVLGKSATAKSAAKKGATHFLDKWFK